MQNIKPAHWHSEGNVYLVAPLLDQQATILLPGKVIPYKADFGDEDC